MSINNRLALDWEDLFDLTSRYHNLEKPANIVAMTISDSQWIQTQINSVKFDDTDALKQAVEQLRKQSQEVKRRMYDWIRGGPEEDLKTGELAQLLQEVEGLVEDNAQNSMNLCRMGGMTVLLELMVSHEND